MFIELFLLLCLLLATALLSASEFAFVITNKIKIEIKALKKSLSALNSLYFFEHPQNFFTTVLVGNNFILILLSSIAAVFLIKYFAFNFFTTLLICVIVIIIIGKILPKYLVREAADEIMLAASIPIRLLSIVFYPFVKIISSFSGPLVKSYEIKEDTLNYMFNKGEIQKLLKESHEAGIVDKTESDILHRILELGDRRVYEAMRPRTDIVGVDITSSINEVLNLFIESGYSKLPVYEDSLDNIKGIVIAHDLFKNPIDLKSILRDVIFVPDTKKCTEMLSEFLKKRLSFAVAIDEFGGTAGILTMEDIIEEMFGEIRDEYDTDDEICRKVADNTYVIGGKVEIDYINEMLGLNISEGDYSTIGGYITSYLGRIPLKGEIVKVDKYNIQILRSSQIRVELVKITELIKDNPL